MKLNRPLTVIGAAAVAAVIAAAGISIPAQSAPTETPSQSAPAQATASDTLAEDLTFMREEERMARDLYLAFAEKYGDDTAFARIAKSEQRHFDATGRMLENFGLEDPSDGLEAGTYADDELTALYEELLEQGMASLEDAYDAAIAVEEADIADLTAAIERTTDDAATRLFENLKRGSEQHLAAYTAYRDGKTPTPGEGREDSPGKRMGRDDAAMGEPGQGQRQGEGRQGQRQGEGRQGEGDRPADCPLN